MFWNKKDMVSVSELNEANERADFWRQKASEAETMWAKTAFELDALKASRARSNENLKLGSAASAKARRKKVDPGKFDFSRPVIAFHVDGREVKITDLEYDGGNDAWSKQIPDRDCNTYFNHRDGVAYGTGWALRHA